MRVAVWPADLTGCGKNRLIWPAECLAAQGADVVIDMQGPTVLWDRKWEGTHPPDDAMVLGCYKPEADVVVFQRPGRIWWSHLIPHLQAQGVRVVVDVDDLFDSIDRGNVARDGYLGTWHNHRHIDTACKLADAVVCTTPALQRRYGHGHGIVVPNLVPAFYLSVKEEKIPHTVGWPGAVGSHPKDLQATRGGINAAMAGTGWRFHVIGSGDRVQEGLALDAKPTATGYLPIDEYPWAISTLEVGIVPLADTPFNAAKSALKASEIAAVGVPVVMSPTPDNLRLHRRGVGWVAETPRQWERKVRALIRNPDLREELAAQGRESMASQTIEDNCGRWWSAWTGEQWTG